MGNTLYTIHPICNYKAYVDTWNTTNITNMLPDFSSFAFKLFRQRM